MLPVRERPRHLAAFVLALYLSVTKFSAGLAEAADVLDLPPIVKEGTPGELLMQDPVVPSQRSAVQPVSGSGTVQKSLSDRLAVPVVGTHAPGGVSQLRGLGRSAESTSVQALGIPLNPPQGGGFDLSVFPQFLWSSYSYQVGPALGTFDPRGTAGSLQLTPWTVDALAGQSPGGRFVALGSTANVFQVSGAYTNGRSVSVVVGSSSGDAQGPSAGLSGRWSLSDRRSLSVHLLITDLDAKSPGPGGATPFARQRTVRAIPLVQLDQRIGEDGLLKSGVFFDAGYLRYDDPSSSALPATQDHSYQVGTENALVLGHWRFGAGARGVRYQALSFEARTEGVVHLLASRVFEAGTLLIEPTLRAVGVSRHGLLPEASLGARGELGSGRSWFARGGLSRQFSSMVNRFYSYPGFPGYPGFVGNPGLDPERLWTAVAGVEARVDSCEVGLQVYGQYVEGAQVRVPLDSSTDTMANLGVARVLSVLGHGRWFVTEWLDLGADFTLSASELRESGLAYPGLPAALMILSAGAHSPSQLADGSHAWRLQAYGRLSSTAVANASGARLPGYHEEDLEFRARVAPGWVAVARVDDLLDQRPELVLGYPSFGRALSVLVSKAL